MNRVIFYTIGYNAEKTLPRTIRSVLSQTIPDWTWYLLDNGSTDRSYDIIRQSASGDPRIIPLHNDKNNLFHPGNSCWDLLKRLDDSDWLCWLDADDAYSPDFLEKMLPFVAENRLEIAACGFNMILDQTGEQIGQRVEANNIVLSAPKEFSFYFPVYYQFIRATWGKLFSVAAIRRHDRSRIASLPHGWDTMYSMEILRNASRFGILARPLHQYYMSPKSLSYRWNPDRIKADQTLHQTACSFLIDKCGSSIKYLTRGWPGSGHPRTLFEEMR